MKESRNNKNKKATKNVASMVTQKVFTDYSVLSFNNYINVFHFNYHAGFAPVASMVMHSP